VGNEVPAKESRVGDGPSTNATQPAGGGESSTASPIPSVVSEGSRFGPTWKSDEELAPGAKRQKAALDAWLAARQQAPQRQLSKGVCDETHD